MLKLSKKHLIIILVIAMLFPISALAIEGRYPSSSDEFVYTTEPTFSPAPDDYDEYGTPIFLIIVPPDVWEKYFMSHPFFQNQTLYDNAIFLLAYDGALDAERRDNRCPRCANWVNSWQEWWPMGHLFTQCPGLGQTGPAFDVIAGWGWRFTQSCNACGWRHTNDSPRISWIWYIECQFASPLTPNTRIVLGGRVPQLRPHQAACIRIRDIVHGINHLSCCFVTC